MGRQFWCEQLSLATLIAHAVSVPQKLIFQTRVCKEVQTLARRWNLLKNATDAGPTRSKRSNAMTPTSAKTRIRSGALVGAEHRVRTGDLRLGKATLYQLS